MFLCSGDHPSRHLIHITGAPTLQEAPAALVDIADGALVIDDATGIIVYSGPRAGLSEDADASPSTMVTPT